jgi:Fur family peroxide stress response transcriptional regulator
LIGGQLRRKSFVKESRYFIGVCGGRKRKIAGKRKEMERALRAAGCRITEQRRVVLDYLADTQTHPSAHKVYEEARKRYSGLSLATVYNTLETLVKIGAIRVIEFNAADNRHETNLTPHVNLICTVCGKILDFEEGFSAKPEMAKARFGFEVKDYRMEYYGICAECLAKRDKKPRT